MKFVRKLLLLVALLCLAAESFASTNIGFCPTTPAPEKAKLEFVVPDMAYNGIPMMVRQFSVDTKVENVLAFYRNEWAKLARPDRPGYLEDNMREWKLISTIQDSCFTVVQVRVREGKTYGLISVSRKPDASTKRVIRGDAVPQLPGSQVLSDIDFYDGVRNARSVVLTNPSHIQANIEYMRKSYETNGWVMFQNLPTGTPQTPSQVMLLKKGYEEMHLVFNSNTQGRTQVVAHWIDRP